MIKKFSVENYKGFKRKISLDFFKHKDYKYNTYAIRDDLINTAVIYGKNASGKSNFGLALFDITLHLVDKQRSPEQYSFYLNANSDKSEAIFSYDFVIDGKQIKYNYKKTADAKLAYEEFYVGNDKVFSYNFKEKIGDFENLKLVNAETLNLQSEDMSISILRYIVNNTISGKEALLNKVMMFVNNMLWFRSLGVNQYIGYRKNAESIDKSIIRNGRVRDFEALLKRSDIQVSLDVGKGATGEEFLVSKFKNNKVLPFLDIASNGTKALTLYYYWSQDFSDISFLFIDEFDAFYHTDLAQEILKNLSEKKQFQMILTTHNTGIMTNRILRPDCYFIVTDGKLLSLPECTDRELREGHNLSKMYKNGEFCE